MLFVVILFFCLPESPAGGGCLFYITLSIGVHIPARIVLYTQKSIELELLVLHPLGIAKRLFQVKPSEPYPMLRYVEVRNQYIG